jgi:hypothetical protein
MTFVHCWNTLQQWQLRLLLAHSNDVALHSYSNIGLGCNFLVYYHCCKGRIKGFVGPRHFSSLGPFGDSKSIVGTTV